MRVIGIDPGYERMGVAVVERRDGADHVLFLECVRTNPSDTHVKRLCAIGKCIAEIVAIWNPDAAAVETVYFSKNTKTALAVAQARGVICYETARAHIPIFEYNPGTVKVAVTGNGSSDKKGVEAMVMRLVTLKQSPLLDDEFDAIAIALTFLSIDARMLSTGTYPLA